VLADDNGQRATLAAQTIEAMGYTTLSVLDGGINRWVTEGFATEWGMNVPSKAFGERVEVQHDVRAINARELDQRTRNGEKVLILDSRTPEEYHEFSIPGGRSVPGGELAYRVGQLIREEQPELVVVNCAGRTRSIIGARILQRMGVPNVVSLKNGTAGWTLAGLELERNADRVTLPEPGPTTKRDAEAFAARVCAEDGVRRLTVDDLLKVTRPGVCAYRVDVRTEAEYASGHIPGFTWFPGGQAVQRADDVVAARAAHVVFCCDGIVRAAVAASWFRQMGFPNVFIVDGGTSAWTARGLELGTGSERTEPFGLAEARTTVDSVSPSDLDARLAKTTVVFVGTSREFAHGHVPGAHWLSRSWLELRIGSVQPDVSQTLVTTDVDGQSAPLAALSLRAVGYTNVLYLAGGMRAWTGAVERGLTGVMQPPDDVVLSGLERSAAEAVEYLRWETALGTRQQTAH
jgi:rhodanese-related sulfurtransferase